MSEDPTVRALEYELEVVTESRGAWRARAVAAEAEAARLRAQARADCESATDQIDELRELLRRVLDGNANAVAAARAFLSPLPAEEPSQ